MESSGSEVLDNYSEGSSRDVEQEIKERVNISSESESVNVTEEIEERTNEEIRKIKQEESQKVTGKATEQKSEGFLSMIMSLFG
ncbi:hypothetical protein [Candidatus Nanohalobium constans]|uniref:hypothetical protein n=1 Tax=Candidatus Nanohalobium constans TaxID=2565781 RepID=UPI0012982540|nr:hypothetical protein [Candidatus Nanohalobium constans]